MAGGLTDYDRAFLRVVRGSWLEAVESNPEVAADPDIPSRRGQLDPSDPDLCALYDTHRYQRHHADAFGEALQHAGIKSASSESPVAVVDIGAGACTVAVAIGERWKPGLPNVHYYAVEPHPKMRQLGIELLGALAWPFGHIQVVDKIDELIGPADSRALERIDSSRLIVAFNYVMQQGSVGQDAISEWAGFLRCLVTRRCEVQLLIVTVAAHLVDNTEALLKALDELDVKLHQDCDHRFNFDSRYPDDDQLARESALISAVWETRHPARARCRSYVLSAA